MEKYKSLHLWMLIPFIIMQVGIFMFYWPTFTEEYWTVHIHYWLATLWYLYLIIQPYYATHGQLAKHRTNGIIAFFIAGGVIFSSVVMLSGDMRRAFLVQSGIEKSNLTPEFFYGVVFIEILMIIAFTFSILKAIIRRKDLEEHAWWLISGVFYIMMPALGRGFFVVVGIVKGNFMEVPLYLPNNIASIIIITILLFFAWKYKKLNHPATWLGVIVNLITFFHEFLGSSQFIQDFLKALIVFRS